MRGRGKGLARDACFCTSGHSPSRPLVKAGSGAAAAGAASDNRARPRSCRSRSCKSSVGANWSIDPCRRHLAVKPTKLRPAARRDLTPDCFCACLVMIRSSIVGSGRCFFSLRMGRAARDYRRTRRPSATFGSWPRDCEGDLALDHHLPLVTCGMKCIAGAWSEDAACICIARSRGDRSRARW